MQDLPSLSWRHSTVTIDDKQNVCEYFFLKKFLWTLAVPTRNQPSLISNFERQNPRKDGTLATFL